MKEEVKEVRQKEREGEESEGVFRGVGTAHILAEQAAGHRASTLNCVGIEEEGGINLTPRCHLSNHQVNTNPKSHTIPKPTQA